MSAVRSLCRTCMINIIDSTEEDVYSFNICETEGLAEKLKLCSSVEVQPNDEYPPHVCNTCYIKIQNCCDFQELCRQSLEKLTKMLKKQTQTDSCVPNILEDYASIMVTKDHLPYTIDIKSELEEDFSDNEMIVDYDSVDGPKCTQDIDIKCDYDAAIDDPLNGTKDCVIAEAISIAKREAMEKGVNCDQYYRRTSEAAIRFIVAGGDKSENEQGDESVEVIVNKDIGLDYNNTFKLIHLVEETPVSFELNPNTSENVSEDVDNKSKDGSNKTEANCVSKYDIKKKIPFLYHLEVGFACPSEDEENYFHSETVQSDNKPKNSKTFACDLCPQTFAHLERLNSHRRRHNELGGYSCPRENCTRVYNRLFELQKHLNDHDGIAHETYKCDLNNCEMEFPHKKYLQLHLREHHDHGPTLPVRKYVCETCGAIFKYSRSLQVHQYIHVDECLWPFKCDVEGCSKSFRSENCYKIHNNRHNGIKPYACTYCDKRFCAYTNLHAHLNCHTLSKKWFCNFCPKVCYTAQTLRVHTRTKHGNKPDGKFSCRHCNKILSSQLARKRHEMRHTGEREFVCDECGLGFIQACSLKKHKQTHLPAETRPVEKFRCSVCNRALPRAIDLKNHEMTHTGEKPFECDTCGVKFRYQSNLQRHQKQKLCRKSKITKDKDSS